MLVGPTGGGKTKIFRCLRTALDKTMGITHKDSRFNPKAIRAQEMYGEVDPSTGEWNTGILHATALSVPHPHAHDFSSPCFPVREVGVSSPVRQEISRITWGETVFSLKGRLRGYSRVMNRLNMPRACQKKGGEQELSATREEDCRHLKTVRPTGGSIQHNSFSPSSAAW